MGESEPIEASVIISVEWQEDYGVGTGRLWKYVGGRADATRGWRGCVFEKEDHSDCSFQPG